MYLQQSSPIVIKINHGKGVSVHREELSLKHPAVSSKILTMLAKANAERAYHVTVNI